MSFHYDIRHFLVTVISGLIIAWVVDTYWLDGRIYAEISTTAPILFRNAAFKISNFVQRVAWPF
jgi:hypothetical protein